MLQKRCSQDEVLKVFKIQGEVLAAKGYVVTKWIKPEMGRFNLNSDECSKGNLGPSGRGSILRPVYYFKVCR